MANPRMGLSAHVGTVLNGTFLIALGAAWGVAELSPRVQRGAFWLLVAGSYGGCLGVLLAALLGTRDATPIHGAAQPASQWKETLVYLVLTVSAAVMLAGTAVTLFGIRRVKGEHRA
jgi:hydroxylaminobenzene mutase